MDPLESKGREVSTPPKSFRSTSRLLDENTAGKSVMIKQTTQDMSLGPSTLYSDTVPLRELLVTDEIKEEEE